MPMSRRWLLRVATIGGAALAGCTGGGGAGGSGDGDGGGGNGGGGEGSGDTPTATEPPTPTPTPTLTATATTRASHEEYSLYNWDRLQGADASSADRIVMRDTEFHPLVAEVPTGPLEFVNEDLSPHTVTIPALDIDEYVGGEESVTVEIGREGTFEYVCTLHAPDMLGRLTVTG